MSRKSSFFDDFDTMAAPSSGVGIIDLTNIPENPRHEIIPAGTYDATVESVDMETSRNSGTLMLTWRFKIETSTKIVYYHTTLTGNGLMMLKRVLTQLAPCANETVDLANFKPNNAALQFVGCPCRVKVRVETYQGEQRNKVSEVMAPAAAPSAGS